MQHDKHALYCLSRLLPSEVGTIIVLHINSELNALTRLRADLGDQLITTVQVNEDGEPLNDWRRTCLGNAYLAG